MKLKLFLASLLSVLPAIAQQPKNLLSFSIGGESIPSNALVTAAAGSTSRAVDYSGSYSLELGYGRALHTFRRVELWLDVPALVGPSHRITSASPSLPTSNATFYVTPSARLALSSKRAFSPWISAGGGYGLYETSDALQNGAGNPTIHTHTGTLQLGAGVDVKTPVHIVVPVGLRASFRDFYTLSQPIYLVPVTGQSQHNFSFTGGITARF